MANITDKSENNQLVVMDNIESLIKVLAVKVV